MQKVVYIAGAITNNPNYKENFDVAEQYLERQGYIILNPSKLPQGLKNEDYMRICFAMIDVADVVAFIPGWIKSHGASLEHNYCEYVGKEIMLLDEAVPYLWWKGANDE